MGSDLRFLLADTVINNARKLTTLILPPRAIAMPMSIPRLASQPHGMIPLLESEETLPFSHYTKS